MAKWLGHRDLCPTAWHQPCDCPCSDIDCPGIDRCNDPDCDLSVNAVSEVRDE